MNPTTDAPLRAALCFAPPLVRAVLASVALLTLAACGEYGGGSAGSGSGAAGTSGSSGGALGTSQQDDEVQAFAQTVHPLTVQYCSECHAGQGPGSPSLAHPDPVQAHSAVVANQKADLANPPASRLVGRLALDLHYCWSGCSDDAASMAAAVAQWANLIGFAANNTVLPNAIRSVDATLDDGIELDPSAARYRDHLIALWEFKEGTGNVAADTSGVDPAIDLAVIDATWMTNFGLDFDGGVALSANNDPATRKIYDRIANPVSGTQQFTVEAWIAPGNISQEGPARIVTYAPGTGRRNFDLGQVQYNYDFRNRLSDVEPQSLRTYDADRDAQAVLQHVVVTYDQYRGRRIYVDGDWTDDVDEAAPGRLFGWDPGFRLAFGNAPNQNRTWQGKMRLVAIHDEALSDEHIVQNYLAGVGKKVLVRFDTSAFAGAGSYIEFLIDEYDDYSYLFCEPTFRAANPAGTRVAGLRIAVNGVIPVAGQAFTTVDSAAFGLPARLSRQCAVIRKDLGPAQDRFSIDFEVLESFEHIEQATFPPPGIDATVLPPVPDTGMRDSARINAAMATVTKVDPALPAVRDVYEDLEEQLPGQPDLRSFVTSNQVGIAKLALEYCDALVEDPGLRDDFFGVFPFDQPPAVALDAVGRSQVIEALYDKVIGVNLATQPDLEDPAAGVDGVRTTLDRLATTLIANCDAQTPCDALRTRSIVKGMCTAVLASGAAQIH